MTAGLARQASLEACLSLRGWRVVRRYWRGYWVWWLEPVRLAFRKETP